MAGIRRVDAASTAPQGQSVGRDGTKGYGLSRYTSVASNGSWSPTVMFLIGLVILEILAYGGFRYLFRSVHGG